MVNELNQTANVKNVQSVNMIYKALNVVTNEKNFIPLSTVMDKPYVAVDDLYLNDHCKFLFEYNYD